MAPALTETMLTPAIALEQDSQEPTAKTRSIIAQILSGTLAKMGEFASQVLLATPVTAQELDTPDSSAIRPSTIALPRILASTVESALTG